MVGKKKNKLRVALRKNRSKKARAKNETRRLLEEQLPGNPTEATDLESSERISGKGELTRRRTIIVGAQTQADRDQSVLIDVDRSRCLSGRVLRATGLTSLVQASDGRQFECSVRRLLKNLARDGRNTVVAGDRVLFQPVGGAHEGVIERVEPRYGVISRNSQGQEHILVSNIDQVAIVVSTAEPPLKSGLIDRLLISAEKGNVPPVVCINKVDLGSSVALQPLVGLYSQLGYNVLLTSATSGAGLAELETILKDRQTVFVGQSGVGKSSLLNAIQPDLRLRVGRVSDWSRKGRHTTRRAELLPLEFGGWVVDTPGIRQMGLWDVLPEEVEGHFIEFRPFVPKCKFPDCSHTHEEGCGVKNAVACGLIASMRYDSYCRIVTSERA